jgi:hypothetical protein
MNFIVKITAYSESEQVLGTVRLDYFYVSYIKQI